MTPRRPAGPRIAVTSSGDFGDRVSALLASLFSHVLVVPGGSLGDAYAAGTDLAVLALSWPNRALCAEADDLSFRTAKPWLAITMDGSVVHVGPVVSPPDGPCYGCFVRRLDQHGRHNPAAEALRASFSDSAAQGPKGYLPHHARQVAGLAATLIDAAVPVPAGGPSAYPVPTGTGLVVSLDSPWCVASRTVPCWDCPRCAGRRGSLEADSVAGVLAGLPSIRQLGIRQHGAESQAAC
jgi:bacteriocin biosynthesis cyclodehydratase domain-containing protein